MKQTSKDGKTWFEVDGTKVKIGFTKSLLAELAECWHIIPASQKVLIKEGQPLLSVETNESLFSIPSPATGIVTFFDNAAMNMPDHLKEDQVICQLIPEEEVKAKKKVEFVDEWVDDLLPVGAERVNRINEQARIRPAEARVQLNAGGLAQQLWGDLAQAQQPFRAAQPVQPAAPQAPRPAIRRGR